jgi:hypothetical protein
MTILSPGLINRKDVERGQIDVSSTQIHDLSMFPLSTSFLLTKPGEKMGMYLCARDIDLSSFYTFSIDLARREDVERGNIDISSTQIHDHFLFWLGQ